MAESNRSIENKKCIIFSILLNTILVYVSLKTCTLRFWTDDDWGIANYMSGAKGIEYATPYIKFINICLSSVLYVMYQLYHEINWFAVAELGVVWLSFVFFTYILVRKLRERFDWGSSYIISALFMLTFCNSFYVRMQFTQTASVGCIAGMVFLMYSFKSDGEKINAAKILGALCICLSFLFRSGCFLLVLPFAFFMVAEYFFTFEGKFVKHVNAGVIVKRHRNCILIWSMILLLYVMSLFVQKLSYGEKYNYYNEFNSARANLIDYERSSYDEIQDGLEEIGVSANDYALITSWTFDDPEFITPDLLKKIKALQPDRDLKENVLSFFQNYAERILTKDYIYTIIVLAFLAILDYKRMKIVFWYVFFMFNGISFYFTVVGRYPSYVKIGIIFAAVCLALYQADFTCIGKIEKKAVLGMSLILALVLAPLGNDHYLSNIGKFEYDFTGMEMYQYLNDRVGDYFVVPTFSSGGLPGIRNSYSVLRSTRSGTFGNIVGLGGWSTGNPDQVAAYNSWGIYSPLRQIADENVYLITAAYAVEMLQTYLYEHTGAESTYALTNVKYGATIYKVTTQIETDKEKQIKLDNMAESIDGTYNTYKIEANLAVESSLEDKEFDVYYSFYEPDTDTTKYFMMYDADHASFKADEVMHVNAMIPVNELETGEKYFVSVVLVDSEGNAYGSSCEKVPLVIGSLI